MPDLLLSTENAVATFTFNRPQVRNALSAEMRGLLIDGLRHVETDASVRCVVFQGAGEHFMSGGDVKSFQEITELPPAERRRRFLQRIHGLHPVMTIMRRMPQPILASVRGAAAGAGVSMALNCDLVMAADSAFFTLAYRHIGLSPDGGATYHLPRAVGIKKAMEIALLGSRFSAAQAMEWGMINKVVQEEKLAEETRDWAIQLATGPSRALGLTKRLMRGSLAASMAEQLQAEAEAFADSAATEDWVEGVRAFNEKRPPRFKGD